MELYVSNGTKLVGKKKSSHQFMHISYLCYIMEQLEITERILNEYIYHMNKNFGMYSDKIKKPINEILTSHSSYHIDNFKYIIGKIDFSSRYAITIG